MRVYCDSSTKEACIIIGRQKPKFIPYDQPVTNNVGEYKAVIYALEESKMLKRTNTVIFTDSLLVVNQVNGEWKCNKKHLLPYRDRVRGLLVNSGMELRWLWREENKAGKILG